MSHLPQRFSVSSSNEQDNETATAAEEGDEESSFCYVDTPDFSYDRWLKNNNSNGIIGCAKGKVLVVGGGVSGAVAAYELSRAGCHVTILEAEPTIGGRCRSSHFPAEPFSPNLVELGAMRFPPTQFVMSYYLDKFGITSSGDNKGLNELPLFPDPGTVPTWIVLGDSSVLWSTSDARKGIAPSVVEKVHNGWIALVRNGLRRNGKQVLQSPAMIQSKLRKAANDDEAALQEATCYWQDYLTHFGRCSFYAVLVDIFTGSSSFDVPGSKVWTFDDFDKFGTLGIGSGGFGSLYPISFIEIWRLIINGLEDQQRFLRIGARSVPVALLEYSENVTLHCGVQVTAIRGSMKTGFTYDAISASKRLKKETFDRVIVATTTRSMEVTLNITDETSLLSTAVATAVRRVHVISSTKIGLRIKKFWCGNNDDDTTPRVLLCDNLVRQVYTIDYDDPDGTAVAFLTYSWDDDAVKHQGLGIDPRNSTSNTVDKVRLYEQLFQKLETCGRTNAELAKWIKNIRPCNNKADVILFIEWQSRPNFNGAFKLSLPGQEQYVQTMFYDYLKAGTPRDTGLYLAGDCIAFTSGWVEGALQTGLNASAAIIRSLNGTLHGPKSPMDIRKDRFNYFATQEMLSTPGNATAKDQNDGFPRKRIRT